jgi:hypothetical protein
VIRNSCRTVYLSDQTYENATRYAYEKGMSFSAVASKLLKDLLLKEHMKDCGEVEWKEKEIEENVL